MLWAREVTPSPGRIPSVSARAAPPPLPSAALQKQSPTGIARGWRAFGIGHDQRMPPTRRRLIAVVVVVTAAVLLSPPALWASADARHERAPTVTESRWHWPLSPPYRLTEPYVQPAHSYAPGHRGIDIKADGSTDALAPADGVVVLSGVVVDRPLLTIDHGDGLVSTLEPVTPTVTSGDSVARGEVVGTLALGGHAKPGHLHLGARVHGEYVNPLQFLGSVPRAVLLPCC